MATSPSTALSELIEEFDMVRRKRLRASKKVRVLERTEKRLEDLVQKACPHTRYVTGTDHSHRCERCRLLIIQ